MSHRSSTAAGLTVAALAFTAALPPLAAGQDLRSPDARDAATRVPVVVRVAPAAPADSGLSWDSAAIGALAGAGLLISMAGGGLLVVRRRPRPA